LTHPVYASAIDSGVPARDALECVLFMLAILRYALHRAGEDHPEFRTSKADLAAPDWTDGSTASIRHEWDLAVGRGHSGERDRRCTGPDRPSVLMTMMMKVYSAQNYGLLTKVYSCALSPEYARQPEAVCMTSLSE